MVKLKKGLLVITLVSLIMLSIRPFSIYADTISSSNIIGVEYSIESYTTLEPDIVNIGSDKYCSVDFTIKAKVKLDDNYFGVINGTLTTNYYDYDISNNTATLVTRTNRTTRDFYVNGNEFSYSFTLRVKVLINSNIQSPISNGLFSIVSSNVVLKEGEMLQWHFPFESLGIVYPTFEYGFEQVGMIQYNNYDFPIFKIPDNKLIYRTYATNGYKYYWIFMADKNYYSVQLLQNNFSVSNGEITAFKVINRFVQNYNLRYIYKVEVTATASQYLSITYNGGSDMKYMPIYFNDATYKYISTDFALLFDLSNEFLDNIDIIAQGTQQSNSSASSLESSTSSFSSTASDVYNVEDQVSSGFSSSMQNIPSSFNFQNNFGSSFVVSASWVRDQFNNMTANNPFGSLITFSLILGVALLIIGRLLS